MIPLADADIVELFCSTASLTRSLRPTPAGRPLFATPAAPGSWDNSRGCHPSPLTTDLDASGKHTPAENSIQTP